MGEPPAESFGSPESFAPPESAAPAASAAWSAPTPPVASGPDPASGFVPLGVDELGARPAPPTAPPIEYEAEPFDPDALFRDDG